MPQVHGDPDRWDVLVVGAGPTGLTLAAQLAAHGASVRVVDQNLDRVRESRALGVQPRTLEVLRPLGVSTELIRRGNPAVRLHLHVGLREFRVPLFDIGLRDTEFPFLLFVSQAQTEAVLDAAVRSRSVPVDRGVRLEAIRHTASGCVATLRGRDGTASQTTTRFVVGCDGAHSTVRELAGIPFRGEAYPQTFLLADLAIDGLEPGAVHSFLADWGPFFCFPLGDPAAWRIISMRPPDRAADPRGTDREELQALADAASGGVLTLHEPVWASAFRVHQRHVSRYRSGPIFLAGDAAHIHSPAGAQGMNTGIQDAVNLGWKLGLVCRGLAPERLLDSYDAERRPVGAFVVRFTGRAFVAATSAHPVVRVVRRQLVPRVLPWGLRFRPGRAAVFRVVSQLGVRYRGSPAVEPDAAGRSRRMLGSGPGAGDRLPDAEVRVDGRSSRLQAQLSAPAFHLLVAGAGAAVPTDELAALVRRYAGLLHVHRLSRQPHPGVLHDASGAAHRRLGIRQPSLLVVRPDGHIGARVDDLDVDRARRYLSRLLT